MSDRALGRVALFGDPPWAAMPSAAALVGADGLDPRPDDGRAGRLDAVALAGPDLGGREAEVARGAAFARRHRLPILDLAAVPLGPAAPPVVEAPPIAVAARRRGAPGGGSERGDDALAEAVLRRVLADRLTAAEGWWPDSPPGSGEPPGCGSPIRPRTLLLDAEDDGRTDVAALLALARDILAGAAAAAAVVVPRRPRRPLVLAPLARRAGIATIVDDGRPDLMEGVDEVRGLDHPLVLEARLRGIPVVSPSLLALDPGPDAAPAAVARRRLVEGVRYADPLSGRPLEPLAGLDRLADLRHRFAARRTSWVGFGMSAQKARTATTFLAGWANAVVFDGRDPVGTATSLAAVSGDARVVAWGAKGGADLEARAAAAGIGVSRLEDGFVRSVGLGTRQTIPASLALDDLGLYYDARRPSRFERLALETDFDDALRSRARALREAIVAARVTKYNLGAARLDLAGPAAGRRIVLVVGQVPDDAAIRFGTLATTGNLALLAAVRAARPDAYVVYKEHPDLVTRSRAGWLPEATIRRHADRALTEGDAVAAIEAADEVHTLTSLAGFEALLRGKPVTTWGIPFYAGWGLTEDREAIARRGRRLDLDELVAVAYLLYPAYVDPVTRLPCEAEDIVARIRQIRDEGLAVPAATRFRRLVRASVVAEAWLRHLAGHRLTPR